MTGFSATNYEFISRPSVLDIVDPVAGHGELKRANLVREEFKLPDAGAAYMVDIVRAFRLARDASVYIEVGTRDKGNIAWLVDVLASDALIIDVDIEQISSAKNKLDKVIKAGQTCRYVEGNSVAESTISRVKDALEGRLADLIFLDSSHMYDHYLKEVELYWSLLNPGGYLLAHDIFWEGNSTDKGKAQAAEFLDKHHPVYTVAMNEPVTRFRRRSLKSDVWGGVGILVK